MDALQVKQNKTPDSMRPPEGVAKRLTRKYNERFKKGGSAGSRLVASFYKGGKI